ncbi:hypothetical protein [Polycladomyces subterraneus]|uniref:Uncharacterized protein n=1 Tax=Polycladomyces subterraneus TaxID=1016997 RepID=A0ABT8IKH3_9BACL|nr:hypothetical protein [Polycladomyces subterraneus]MDN4593298.1 hypothetical protein [Polycladomyces subterraneus]
MGYITFQERLYLGRYISSLQRTTTGKEQNLNLSILNKLENPDLPFERGEYNYLINKLSDRLEDACDCRSEYEINLLQSLIMKLEKRMESLK